MVYSKYWRTGPEQYLVAVNVQLLSGEYLFAAIHICQYHFKMKLNVFNRFGRCVDKRGIKCNHSMRISEMPRGCVRCSVWFLTQPLGDIGE